MYTGSLAMGVGNSFNAQSRFFGSDIAFKTGEHFNSTGTTSEAIAFDAYITRVQTDININTSTTPSGEGLSVMPYTAWPSGYQNSKASDFADQSLPIRLSAFSMWNRMSGSFGHENMHFLYSTGASSPSHLGGPLNIYSGSYVEELTDLPDDGVTRSTNKTRWHKTVPSASVHIRAHGSNTHPQIIISQYESGDAGLTFDLDGTRQYSLGIDNTDDKFKINVDAESDPRNANPSSGTNALTINTSGQVEGLTSAGDIDPAASATYDLGSTSLRWNNIYTTDIQLSNMDKDTGNEVDGTRGDWTIQEGKDDLFLINRLNNKKYKFKLEEVKDE